MTPAGEPSPAPPAGAEFRPGLAVCVLSFSLQEDLPGKCSRGLTGSDSRIAEFIAADPEFPRFLEWLAGMLTPLLLRFEEEGRIALTLAVGCTGGRHRSVFVAERIASWLREQGQSVSLLHRDIDRIVL